MTRTVTVTQNALASELTVTPSDQQVPYTSGSTSFSVSSNTNWAVSDDASWLTVSPSNGSKNGTITATFTENTSTVARLGTITLTGGGITRTVTVRQKSTPVLIVTPADQHVSYKGDSTTFAITSNKGWAVWDDSEWLTVMPTNGSDDGTLTVTVAKNTNTVQRIGTITITGGGITRTVTVTQESMHVLIVTPADQHVSYKQDSTTFTISSNRSWSVEDDSEWLTVVPTSGTNDGTLTVTVAENTNTVERVGTITITGARNNKDSNSNTRISTNVNSYPRRTIFR